MNIKNVCLLASIIDTVIDIGYACGWLQADLNDDDIPLSPESRDLFCDIEIMGNEISAGFLLWNNKSLWEHAASKGKSDAREYARNHLNEKEYRSGYIGH